MSDALEISSAATAIETLLREEIGLDATTVGGTLVQRAVHRRMKKCGVTVIAAYLEMLSGSGQELQELVEEVVVPETYFFREPDGISDIARRALARHQRSNEGAPLRVLSVPCSTGEEPYSIAMALLAAGLPPEAVAIDGIDVSFEAVRRARDGIYHGGSFRGDAEAWMGNFIESSGSWELRSSVRSLVRFAHGNLISSSFEPPCEQYDVIFCRNLLIYFDADAQARALSRLETLLAPDGVLVVGAADSFAARRSGFEPAPGHERSFLFRRQGSASAIGVTSAGPDSARRIIRSARPAKRRAIQPSVRRVSTPRATTESIPADTRGRVGTSALFTDVARLANEGQLDAALRVAEVAVRDGLVSAELFSLMGTTHAAIPNLERAEACYRSALFLDPDNEEALLHLALLLEKRGELVLATSFRTRARRALSFRVVVAS